MAKKVFRNCASTSELNRAKTTSQSECVPGLQKHIENLRERLKTETDPKKIKRIEEIIESCYNSITLSPAERLALENQKRK